MGRIAPYTPAFVGGILGKEMEGRVDYAKYGHGLRQARNAICTPTGGIFKRPGFRFVAKARDNSGERLIPFDFNGTEKQSYILELSTSGFIRFFTQGAQIYSVNGPLELPCPALIGLDLTKLNYVQSADVIYFVHPLMQPWRLERYGALNWAYQPLEFMTNDSWPLPFAAGNYPSVVRIYEDRLIFAATPQEPVNVWMSRTSNFLDFRINTATDPLDPPLDNDAIFLRLNGSRVNPIMGLLDMEQLIALTNAAEIRIAGADTGAPLTPSTAGHKRQSSLGSSGVAPDILASSALFVSRTGKKLHTLDYVELGYRFTSAQLNILAPEVIEEGVAELHSMSEPHQIAWCILKNGMLAGCTYLKEQNVYAWHRHDTQGQMKSGAIIPYDDGDQFWVYVIRNGQGYIEYLESPFDIDSEDATQSVFMDSLVSGVAAQNGQISGAGHLAGMTVQLVGDGSYFGEFVVSADGVVSSPKIKAGMNMRLGLGYDMLIQPMRVNYAMQGGQAVSRKKRVLSLTLGVLGSIMGEARAEYDNGEVGEWQMIVAFPYSATGGVPPKCRTENIEILLAGNSAYSGLISIRQVLPFPFYLASLSYIIDQGQ